MNYQPQAQDAEFLLFDVLGADTQLAQLPAFAQVDADLMRQILQEASVFVADKIAPLNRIGDEQGVLFQSGQVTMPNGFVQAYQDFWQAGWASLSCHEEDGGQGLPELLNQVLYGWLSGANHGWTMAPGLLHGAYECIKHHASQDIQTQYLQKIASGEWLATMCLTEPHAGSDLGLVRTRATPVADGRYALNGTKIFISGGEHDLTSNIVHLVLARMPDAPSGSKGLSLFIVPKFYSDGARSAVVCERIEEKMGLHGSPTCVMRFDDAVGWLIGQAGRGLSAMFVMMNAARLHVALQSIGLLDAAHQKAHAYALERRQMRVSGKRDARYAADLIIEHPAIRRILDTQELWVNGLRVLAYQTALELDIAKHHPDMQRRAQAEVWCSLLTPVLKATCSEQAFEGASQCLQVLGGHGYVREWGIEQIVRDTRITMIYEGTNEIQAVDLLLRKIAADGGAGLQSLLDCWGHDLDGASLLWQTTQELLDSDKASAHPSRLLTLVAGEFLRCLALLGMRWAWQKIAAASMADARRPIDHQRLTAAFERWIWPEFAMRLGMMKSSIETPDVFSTA